MPSRSMVDLRIPVAQNHSRLLALPGSECDSMFCVGKELTSEAELRNRIYVYVFGDVKKVNLQFLLVYRKTYHESSVMAFAQMDAIRFPHPDFTTQIEQLPERYRTGVHTAFTLCPRSNNLDMFALSCLVYGIFPSRIIQQHAVEVEGKHTTWYSVKQATSMPLWDGYHSCLNDLHHITYSGWAYPWGDCKLLFAQFLLNPRLMLWSLVLTGSQNPYGRYTLSRVDKTGAGIPDSQRGQPSAPRMTAEEVYEWCKDLKVTSLGTSSGFGERDHYSVMRVQHPGGNGVGGGSTCVRFEYVKI